MLSSIHALRVRLGIDETARRIGRKPATVRRWIKAGKVPAALLPLIRRVFGRHVGALKAAETRRQRREVEKRRELPPAERPKRRRWFLPPQADIPRNEVIPPTEPPKKGPAKRKVKHRPDGGVVVWVPINKQIQYVTVAELVRKVQREVRIFDTNYVYATFVIWRYLANSLNPEYIRRLAARGQKPGTWVTEDTSTTYGEDETTVTAGNPADLRDLYEPVMDRMEGFAEKRTLFFEGMYVTLMDHA